LARLPAITPCSAGAERTHFTLNDRYRSWLRADRVADPKDGGFNDDTATSKIVDLNSFHA
jgi:hypothetical protein